MDPSKLDKKNQLDRELDESDYELLAIIFGERHCSTSSVDKFINYVLLALIVAILVIILFWPNVDNALAYYVMPNIYLRVLFKAAIIFIFIFILDRLINDYRHNLNICD